MFLVGAFAALAQVVFVRETMVAFFGNELTIGVVLAGWLIGIGLGSLSAKLLMRFIARAESRRRILVSLLLVSAALLPVQIHVIRILRLLLDVPPGEYASLGVICWSSLAVFLPTCFTVGVFFPVACEVAAADRSAEHSLVVGRLYALESLGSMAGGVALTFALLPFLDPFAVILLGQIVLAISAMLLLRSMFGRIVLVLLVASLAVGGFAWPGWAGRVEQAAVFKRWEAFGAIGRQVSRGSPPIRLVASMDTRYQNLAVTESDGQYNLFGNGRIYFSFPDPQGYEHSIHFVMAQNPAAKRVLLIGGNPVGDIPELLKYPLERLVHVELDPGVGKIVSGVAPAEYAAVMADRRVARITDDAPRYVKQCGEKFDAILVNAPDPGTAAANRFFTLEFFRDLRRILDSRGFVYTAVSSSERLQGEAIDLGASIYKSIKAVFPVVFVTAEARNRFVAGGPESGLTFDRDTLFRCSKEAGIAAKYFRPVYFLGADEIAADKTKGVIEKFEASAAPVNTGQRPVACFYNLQLWLKFSGSGGETIFRLVRDVRPGVLAGGMLVCGVLGLAAGMFAGRRGDGGLAWSRIAILGVILTVGFTGMALEMALIFMFQGMFGYVYAKMGLMFAAFMLGLALGGRAGGRLASGGGRPALLLLMGMEVLVMLLALGVAAGGTAAGAAGWQELLIYAAVVAGGWAVGVEFMLATRLFRAAGGTGESAVAVVNSADLVGAAIGSAVVGVFAVPVLGIVSTCLLLAVMKLAALLWLGGLVVLARRAVLR